MAALKREGWTKGSFCFILSRSENKWFLGKIEDVVGELQNEWLVVKYGNNFKKTKKIQRNSEFIKEVPSDHAVHFKVSSLVSIYSTVTNMWCDGKIIDIFKDKEGEWLKITYYDQDIENVVEIQRFSSDLKYRSIEKSEEKQVELPEPPSWQQIDEWIIDYVLCLEGANTFIRTPEMEQTYQAQKKRNAETYVKYSDFIKHTIFKCDVVTVDNKLKAVELGPNQKFAVLEPNVFPYHLPPHVDHLVLFATHSLLKYEIESMVEADYPNMDYLWWRNLPSKQSIPDIWHVQIIIKNQIVDGINLLLCGFLSNSPFIDKIGVHYSRVL